MQINDDQYVNISACC